MNRRSAQKPAKRPNVLFIAIDDMNDWISLLDEKAPIKTPNLERLSKRGVLFTHAYCSSAACNPSRASLLTGLRPSTSGVYGNNTDWRKTLPNAKTIMQHFMDHNYYVAGAGKIFHHHPRDKAFDDASFHDFQKLPPWPPDQPMPSEKLNGKNLWSSPNADFGVWPPNENDHVDVKTANYVINKLQQKHDKPFFLAAGIFRPHMPFFCPAKYFGQYPVDQTQMPEILEDDCDDLPKGASQLLSKQYFFKKLMIAERKEPGIWKRAVNAYQACCSFADAQIGRIIDALDVSPHKDNTIIVLWSDHGYHLGEKQHWEKFALWEKTNHIPFIVVAPGVTRPGTKCDQPVDLINLYPTLIDLCGLAKKPELDGKSLVPLLKKPHGSWDAPALMTYQRGNHAVITKRWRYIRYSDGTEELYDHQSDPHEWTNLASTAEHRSLMNDLQKWMPKKEASEGPNY